MNSIISFFQSIGRFLVTAYELFIGLIGDFIEFLKLTAKLGQWLGNFISWLPYELQIFAFMLFSCVIFYKILGREG